MSILIVGSIALDTVKTPYGKKKNILGGSAVYSSISASFFSPVSLVAVIGEDFPQKYLAKIAKKRINLQGVKIEKGRTFRWEGEYDQKFCDPQTISTHLNVFSNFNPIVPQNYRTHKYIFLANIDPSLQQKVLSQIKHPKLVVADTMNYWIKEKKASLLKTLKKVDLFLLNESEAKQLTAENTILKAAKKILKMGPKIVIIKRGEYGAVLIKNNYIFCLPAYLLEKVVDPTGAGDSFAGGVIGYLAKQKSINEQTLRNALIYGTVMASFAVESFSLEKLFSINKTDINFRIKQFKKIIKL